MKLSQAFAAFRQSLITDKNHAILNELVPSFNAECEDIRRRVEEDFNTYKNQAKADNLKKALTYDLVMRRKQVIEKVQEELQNEVDKRLARDGATIEELEVPDSKREGHVKTILQATFPDESVARVPQALWIDYSAFDRVWTSFNAWLVSDITSF